MADVHKGTVLIVDDDKFLADMYSMKFSREGYAVQACLSVDNALAALKKGYDPDVVVFDLVMPEKDGFSLLQEIKNGGWCKHAALIALTNQSNDTERTKAEELGCDRYIVKAVTIPSEVVQMVGEEIAKKRK